MTDTDDLLQRLRDRADGDPPGWGRMLLDAADEIERLRAEVANLKIDAAMDGSIAADNRDQRTHFTAQWRAEKDRATRAESELAALREEIARYATSLTVALGHRDEFKRRAEAAESELAALRGRIAEARLGHLTWVGEDDGGWAIVPDDDGAYWDYEGERVRLLIETAAG